MGTRGKRGGKAPKVTEHDIQQAFIRTYLHSSTYQYILENLYVFAWESDLLYKTKSGYWYELEIKISLADFKRDARNKAKKFAVLEHGDTTTSNELVRDKRPNYFSYCVTEDLVEKVMPLLPAYAGLYSLKPGSCIVKNVRAPMQLHKDKLQDSELKLCEKFYYNYRSQKAVVDGFADERLQMRYTIQAIKAEFKAVTGYDIEDNF